MAAAGGRAGGALTRVGQRRLRRRPAETARLDANPTTAPTMAAGVPISTAAKGAVGA